MSHDLNVQKSWSTLELKSVDTEKRIITGIASTPAADRDGDVVEPKGARFSLPFPLLHQHNHDAPIGQVTSAKATAQGIEIVAKIAEKSELGYVEQAWKQIKSGLVRGLSIGFRPLKAEPIKGGGGYRFTDYEIFELSAVTVPANSYAGITSIKAFDANPADLADHLIEDQDVEKATEDQTAAAEIKTKTKTPTPKKEKFKMSISDKIVAAEESLNAIRDELHGAIEAADDSSESLELRKGLQERFDRAEENLNLLKNHEQAVAGQSAPVAKAQVSVKSAPAVVRASSLKGGDADLFVKSAAAALEAHVKRVPVEQILEERFGGDERVKAVSGITKGVENPAMTNATGWAQELTRESFAGFMDLLQPESVVVRLGLQRYEFNGSSKIQIPHRAGNHGGLAGAFRAEGAPIRVGAAAVSSTPLTPKSLGVIGTFTNELFECSTPNILDLIRRFIVQDTAIALDTAFLDALPASAVRPAGMQNGLLAANTGASAGITHANIVADLRARFSAFAQGNLGSKPIFCMNPARAVGLELALTGTGSAAFPSMTSGTLMGAPVITSTTVPGDVIFLIDTAEVAWAGGAPKFLGTDIATIHEEDTTPLPIVDGAATPKVASPVRSLYQTNSAALRMVMDVDWAVLRPGAVQTITGAAY